MNMKSAAIDDLLNDGSSKVWLINKVIFSGINTVESSLYQKQIMVFHSSQNIDIIQLNSIGKKNAKKGDFNIDPDSNEIQLNFEDEKIKYEITYLTKDSVYLTPKGKLKTKPSIQLIPLPEF